MSIFLDDLRSVVDVFVTRKALHLLNSNGDCLFKTDGTLWCYGYDGIEDTLQDQDEWYEFTHCETGEVFKPSAGLVPDWLKKRMYKITMYWKPENVKFGLIQGRHKLPVNTYIFGRIDDPTNLNKMAAVAMNWASTLPKGEDIEIYVTGLTVAVVEVLNALKLSDYTGTVYLMHYDSKKGDYFPQVVL